MRVDRYYYIIWRCRRWKGSVRVLCSICTMIIYTGKIKNAMALRLLDAEGNRVLLGLDKKMEKTQ